MAATAAVLFLFLSDRNSNHPHSHRSVLHTVRTELLRGNRIFWSFLAVAVVYFSPSVMPFITALSELSRLGAQQLIEMTFPNTHTLPALLWATSGYSHTHTYTHSPIYSNNDIKTLLEVMSTEWILLQRRLHYFPLFSSALKAWMLLLFFKLLEFFLIFDALSVLYWDKNPNCFEMRVKKKGWGIRTQEWN